MATETEPIGSMGDPGAYDAPSDWFWEGAVVEAIARHLRMGGWTIAAMADTASKQRGPDIEARRDGRTLLVEAKGFPSKVYRDPKRAGQSKPTNPSLQAQHWFAQALLKAVRLQFGHPDATVAIGLPDFPRYRTLLGEADWALKKLAVGVFLVTAKGEVVDQRSFERDAR